MNRLKRQKWIVPTLAVVLILGWTLVRIPAHAQAGPEVQAMGEQIQLYRNLLGLILDFRKIAEDEAAAGVAAVLSVEDQTADRNAAIEFLTRMLPHAKSEVVRRAIRIQLVDHYKETRQREKALAQIEMLIKGDSGGN